MSKVKLRLRILLYSLNRFGRFAAIDLEIAVGGGLRARRGALGRQALVRGVWTRVDVGWHRRD